jgi:hypothetical protein
VFTIKLKNGKVQSGDLDIKELVALDETITIEFGEVELA